MVKYFVINAHMKFFACDIYVGKYVISGLPIRIRLCFSSFTCITIPCYANSVLMLNGTLCFNNSVLSNMLNACYVCRANSCR